MTNLARLGLRGSPPEWAETVCGLREAKGRYGRLPGPLPAGILAFIVMGLYLGFTRMGLPDRSMLAATGSRNDMLAATFPMCGVGRRITCIVDGDTFWLDGVRIRIAD